MVPKILLRIVIIVVLSVILLTLFLTYIPSVTQQYLPPIVNYVIPIKFQQQPCDYYCYSHPTDWEVYLMKGNFKAGGYNNVIGLPDFFSCNYQMLELATHALELSKWRQSRPVVFLNGIKDSLNLILNPIGESLKDIELSGKHYDTSCKLHWVSGENLTLYCPRKVFSVPPKEFKATVENDCRDDALYSAVCEVKRKSKVIEYSEDYCDSGACNRIRCDKLSDYHKVCEEGVWYYPGGDVISCDNTISFNNDDVVVNYGHCTLQSGEDVGECNDELCGKNSYYKCDVDFTNYGYEQVDSNTRKYVIDEEEGNYYTVTTNDNDISIKYHDREGDKDCAVLFAEGSCVVYCGDVSQITSSLYDVRSDGYTISSLSNKYLYGNITNYFIYYIGKNSLGLYSLVVGVPYDVLVPRNKVVEAQKGLRNYGVTFNPLAPVHALGAQLPVIYDPWLIPGATTFPRYFENATMMLYNCVSGGYCDDHPLLDFKHLCKKDTYLRDYPFVDCFDRRTFAQKLNVSNFYYSFRKGRDIYNGFYCRGNYDACNVVDNYSSDDCRPAWETYLKGSGRCEDFAIFYYTLFRTMGLPDGEGVSLNLSYCNIPCPCKLLAERCSNVNYTQVSCIAPQYVTVNMDIDEEDCPVDLFPGKDGCTFNACPAGMKGIKNYIDGSVYDFEVNGKLYKVYQNFASGGKHYFPVYLSPDFSTGKMTYSTPYGTGNDYCADYPSLSTDALISQCANYVDDDRKADFINDLQEVCNDS